MRRRFAGTIMRKPLRILALTTDCYGGTGGIATYARDAVAAFASDPRVGEVVVLPRRIDRVLEPIPPRVTFDQAATGSVSRYVARMLAHLSRGRFDAVWTSHLHLAPVALAAARLSGCRWGLVLHGWEAWHPSSRAVVTWAAGRADLYLPVSQLTLERFATAFEVENPQSLPVPGSVDLDRFTPGPASESLRARFGIGPGKLILTVGRLDPFETAKGFDRVIRALPALRDFIPDVRYLIVGGGVDRGRLEQIARDEGVADRVIFAGYLDEAAKLEAYRLADCYAMPSTREGLGIVFLEAMACGLPVICSTSDGGAEALRLAGGGEAVDPEDQMALVDALRRALHAPHKVPTNLDYFSNRNFALRYHRTLSRLIGEPVEV